MKKKSRFQQVIQSFMRKLGFELHRYQSDKLGMNAYQDQFRLMGSKKELTIFDIGAHFGETSQKYRRYFPKAKIFAFEPTPTSFEKLKILERNDPLIKPVQLAIAEAGGVTEFRINQYSPTNSLLARPTSGRKYYRENAEEIETISVPVITIDEYCVEQNLSLIDILKMDIQGAELLALQGATDLLGKAAIGLIYSEVMFTEIYQNCARFYELCQFLSEYDYTLYGLYNFKRGSNGQLTYGDAIFLGPHYRQIVDSIGVNTEV